MLWQCYLTMNAYSQRAIQSNTEPYRTRVIQSYKEQEK